MKEGTQELEQDRILRFVRLARALEFGGIYNGAKLLRALAFSAETRLSRLPEGVVDTAWIHRELELIIQEMQQSGNDRELLLALDHARQGALENRTISIQDAPPVFVCRFCGEITLKQPPNCCPGCGARKLTFREILPTYYLEPLTPAQALEGLEFAVQEVIQQTTDLSEQQMIWSPEPGEWAVRDLILHLLTAQQLLAGRVEKMLTEENPSLKSLAAWAEMDETKSTGKEALDRYVRSRLITLSRLKEISQSDWQRTGFHDEFGQVTILQQAGYFARHDQFHLPQLEDLNRSMMV